MVHTDCDKPTSHTWCTGCMYQMKRPAMLITTTFDNALCPSAEASLYTPAIEPLLCCCIKTTSCVSVMFFIEGACCICATLFVPLQALIPSAHVCWNPFARDPHFPNQVPPVAQQLRLLDPAQVPHFGQPVSPAPYILCVQF